MSYRPPRNDTSRKAIDRAIGILVGLRACSPDDAFAEVVRVVHRTEIGVVSLAAARLALARGRSGHRVFPGGVEGSTIAIKGE